MALRAYSDKYNRPISPTIRQILNQPQIATSTKFRALSLTRKGRTNYYTPLVSEREYLAQESRNILDRLYGGSLASFATALCDSGVSREDIEKLRDMLERGSL